MRRLIDVTDFIEVLEKESKESVDAMGNTRRLVSVNIETLMQWLKEQPIAFDIDKVIEEMEKQIDEYENKALECQNIGEDEMADGIEFRAMGLRDAIEIVERGGINE